MRNNSRGNLVVGALKNKKLSRLQKKLFLLPFLEFEKFFLQFSKFPIQILHKNLSLDYYYFLIFVKEETTRKKLNGKISIKSF